MSSPAPWRFAPSSRPSAMMRAASSASRQTVFVPPTSMPRTDITDILPSMIVLSGADLVLPGSVQSEGTLVLDGNRIVEIRSGALAATSADVVYLHGHIVLPGFIDVHVHGL